MAGASQYTSSAPVSLGETFRFPGEVGLVAATAAV